MADMNLLAGVGIVMFVLSAFMWFMHMLYGWDNIFAMIFGGAEGEVLTGTEPDPAHGIWHLLRDGSTARVVREEEVRAYNIDGLKEPLVFLRYYYDRDGEKFSDVCLKGQLEPKNKEARLGLDGAVYGFRNDSSDKENDELKRQLAELGSKINVKNADIAVMYEDHKTHMKKVAEDTDYISKKMGKVTVSGRPADRRKAGEPLYSEEMGEGEAT